MTTATPAPPGDQTEPDDDTIDPARLVGPVSQLTAHTATLLSRTLEAAVTDDRMDNEPVWDLLADVRRTLATAERAADVTVLMDPSVPPPQPADDQTRMQIRALRAAELLMRHAGTGDVDIEVRNRFVRAVPQSLRAMRNIVAAFDLVGRLAATVGPDGYVSIAVRWPDPLVIDGVRVDVSWNAHDYESGVEVSHWLRSMGVEIETETP